MGECCNCMGYHEQPLDWLMEEMRRVINEWAEVKKENEDFTKDIDGKIVILEKDFADLKTYVDNYFANLDVQDEVNKKLDQMVADGTFDEIIRQFFNRKIIMVGDSYILGYSNDGNIYNSFAQIMKQNLPFDITVLGTSGAGFAQRGTGTGEGKNFLETLQTFTGDQSAKDAITDIYVIGGYNDRTHTVNDIQQAIEEFYNGAITEFKNAKIHIGFIGWSLMSAEYGALAQGIYAYSAAGVHKIDYLAGSEVILRNSSFFTTDNVHPNQAGHNILASYLASAVMGGGISVSQTLRKITPPPINTVQFPDIYMSQTGSMLEMYTNQPYDIDIHVYGAPGWSDDYLVLSDVIDGSVMVGFESATTDGVCVWSPMSDPTKFYECPFFMRIVNRQIFIKLLPTLNGEKFTSPIQKITLPAFRILASALEN